MVGNICHNAETTASVGKTSIRMDVGITVSGAINIDGAYIIRTPGLIYCEPNGYMGRWVYTHLAIHPLTGYLSI